MYVLTLRESILFRLNETQKGSLRSEISDTNPFLTQFTVIQKTKTTLSGAGTLSVKNDASRTETLIPQRNSFYEENVSKLRNVIIVLFSA